MVLSVNMGFYVYINISIYKFSLIDIELYLTILPHLVLH